MSDACPHPREGGKPARGGPGWEHTAGSLPRTGICRVRPLRKGWVVGHHRWHVTGGGGTNPSPFPPYPKMRKCALPSLPRLSEMSPWCTGGGRPFLCAPWSWGRKMQRGDTAPNPNPDPDPTASSPMGWGPLVPRWDRAQDGDISMVTPPWDPPMFPTTGCPLPRDAAVPSACPRAVRHPLPQTAVPAGGSGGHHMSLLNPSHSWGFLQTPTCPPARPARAPAP